MRYSQHGEELEQYSSDKQWWLDFERKWAHTIVIEFVDVEPTKEQLKRLDEVRLMPNDFGSIYSKYVETGDIINEVPEYHPFKLIILKNENESQGQTLTDAELENMLQGQQLTDIELRLLSLEGR